MRVVLLTRTGRPSGVMMARALLKGGVPLLAIVAERRSAMLENGNALQTAWGLLRRHGAGFLWGRLMQLYRRPASLEDVALAHGLPLHVLDDHNSYESQELLRALRPDVLVVANTRKLKPEIFQKAPQALNLHGSLLPRYAGLDSTFWALYHRERDVGFTIHRVARGLDAGEILYQEKIPVDETCDLEAVEAEIVYRGTMAMARVLRDLKGYLAKAQPQDVLEASYYTWPSPRQRALFRRYRRQLGNPEPLKVCHLITRMVRGGAQENTLATVCGLRDRGYRAVLGTGPSEGPEGSMEPQIMSSRVPWRLFRSLVREVSLLHDLRTLFSLARWMRRERFLIVHTHSSKAGTLGRIAARWAGVPVVVHTPHGHVFHGYFGGGLTRLFLAIERWLAKKTDRMIALTAQEAQDHLKQGVGVPDRFAVIPSGVSVQEFDPGRAAKPGLRRELGIPKDATVVGTVARLAPVKGVDILLEAFAKLPADNLYCLIVGDGSEKEALQAQAKELGIEGRVGFAGYRHDIPDILATIDLFVLASRNEGMGRVIVQAGLMQRPIVASATSGIRTLIRDGHNGLLFPPGDSGALRDALAGLMRDQGLCTRLGREARLSFRHRYTEEGMVQAIDRLYAQILKEKGIPAAWAKLPVHEETTENVRIDEKLLV